MINEESLSQLLPEHSNPDIFVDAKTSRVYEVIGKGEVSIVGQVNYIKEYFVQAARLDDNKAIYLASTKKEDLPILEAGQKVKILFEIREDNVKNLYLTTNSEPEKVFPVVDYLVKTN